jgi:hypothetical protein
LLGCDPARAVADALEDGKTLMHDLAAISIAAACFAFAFALVWVLSRV